MPYAYQACRACRRERRGRGCERSVVSVGDDSLHTPRDAPLGADLDARLDAALDAAIREAERGWSAGGIPIGAVLMDDDGVIVARGHNRRVQDDDPTAHAEITCIRNAGRRRDWHALTLVSTLSPCPLCSGAVVLFRIPRVVIGEHETFVGAETYLVEQGVALTVRDDPRCVALMRRLQNEQPDLWAEDIGR
ncbi:MAG: nucleoside deaminase [Phycisphaerales bacterium]|nr:nucleoside deaminase [Phycisphaerales bacterium]